MKRLFVILGKILPGRRSDAPGIVEWLMIRVRRRLLIAGVLLFAAPGLLGWFLWRAANEDKLYTTQVPLVVFASTHDGASIEKMLNDAFPAAAEDYLGEPDVFLRGHQWQQVGNARSVRHEFVSTVTTGNIMLATESHRGLVLHFAEIANEKFPELRFAAGDEIAASNSLEVDDSEIRRNTRLSLICGASTYALGLTLLAMSVVQVRWEFG